MNAAVEPRQLEGHLGPVQTIVFGPGGLLATADTERHLTIWRDGVRVGDFDLRSKSDKVRPIERVRSIAFSRSGDRVYVASGDKVRAIDTATGEVLWIFEPPRAWCFLIISPNTISVTQDDRLVIAFENGQIAVYDRDGHVIGGWNDNDAPRYAALLPDGRSLVGTDRFTVCVWDAENQAKIARFTLPERLYALAVSPAHPWVATRELSSVTITNVESGETLLRIPIMPGVPLVAFSTTDPVIAAGEAGGVTVFDLYGRTVMRCMEPGLKMAVAAFTPDGRWLAAGCSDGAVRFYAVPATSQPPPALS
ncbi:MAG TPA: WD40 repeat domain-containing protein [Fimbriimonadaceae bacterium]|nr:WD40 repeat domain-containing protein [Fimbriimonadaceae bacterium]